MQQGPDDATTRAYDFATCADNDDTRTAVAEQYAAFSHASSDGPWRQRPDTPATLIE